MLRILRGYGFLDTRDEKFMEIRLRNHIKLIFFTVISILVMLELTLFLSGRYLLWQRRAAKSRAAGIRIVCAGDSHTFGVGTSMRYSYPMQLERLLNLNNYNQRFSVINLGIPGAGVRRQAQELKLFFNSNDAKIVILLTGRNNDFEIKKWKNASLCSEIGYYFSNLRSFKFLKEIFFHTIRKNKQQDNNDTRVHRKGYVDYLNFYLERIRELCRDEDARLVLLSYYNSSDTVINEFAQRYHIPYFNFTADFKSLFEIKEKAKYISLDESHMNHKGYKFFAERLYGYLFLNQEYLNLKINPFLKLIEEAEFYANDEEIRNAIRSQKARVEESRGTVGYSFELIHLGHIYIEIGDEQSAKQCYETALVSSGYSDNNTIAAPIINWYLRKGQKEAAMKICDEILSHNPGNNIARSYRNWLISDNQPAENL